MTAPITTSHGPAAHEPQDAADRLSAYFLRRFLTEARVGESLIGGSSPANGQFADMLRDALANAMSEGDRLGLAEAFGGLGTAEGPESLGATLTAIRAHASVGAPDPRVAVAPVEGIVSSRFGLRVHPVTNQPDHHKGVDLAAPLGTPVRSAGQGVVVRAEEAGNYGNLVVIDHGGGLQTRYAHLAQIDVEVGAELDAGARLGSVGNTGRSTGPHLHFEVRRDGQAENPLRVVSGLNAAAQRSR